MIRFETQNNLIASSKVAFKSEANSAVSVPIVANNSAAVVNQTSSANNYISPINTALRTTEEQKKYNEVAKELDSKSRGKLNELLKIGVLLSNNSNDNSTVLDNLHKIVSEPRIKGLDSKNILKETLVSISNPYSITQNFGDMPDKIAAEIIRTEVNKGITKQSLNVRSAACVATSIEFNIANKMPAEFTRMVAGLSSENYSVAKKLKLSDISANTVDAIWLLNEFKVPYKLKNWDEVEVLMQPDRNAIIRSRVQTSYKDPGERSSVDVLMQSTLMNMGSQGTYDSLTDTRTGKYNPDNKGLTDIEKNFAEEVAEGQAKISITYQIIDDNGRLAGSVCDFETVKKHLMNALKAGNNVIIGYTQTNSDKKVINGHEITIIGFEQDKDGKLTFICNDTDDDKPAPIKWAADDLIPLIHHAGLPTDVLKEDVEVVDSWREVLDMYKKDKEQPNTQV